MSKRNAQRSSSIHIDDAALEEILLRLPSLKSAIRCSVVSKHWKSLIRCPFLLKRLKDRYFFQPHALIISCADPHDALTHHTVVSIDETLQSSEFRLELPPCINPEFFVAATCNDVFLYRSPKLSSDDRKYYLCNAFRKQYVAIPPIPHDDNRSLYSTRFGLMCDGNIFRVVVIHGTRRGLHANIFSSEENRWRKKTVLSWSDNFSWFFRERELRDTCYLNGTLFMHSRKEESIFAYNFSDEGIHKIKIPAELSRKSGLDSIALGVYHGSLRLLQISFPCVSRRHNAWHCGLLRVWELGHCVIGGWSLKFEATWKEIVKDEESWKEICDHFLDEYIVPEDDGPGDRKCIKLEIKALGLDPNDEEKVYFVSHQNSVFSCNLRAKVVNLLYKAVDDIKHAFHIALRQTPIPLPTLPSDDDSHWYKVVAYE